MFWDEKELDEQYKDPRNWKFGVFYYNRRDKRLFIPKRNPKFGSTMNFANPRSIFYMSIPLIIFIVISIAIILAI